MSKEKIEIYGAHGKFNISEVRAAIARKKSSPSASAPETRHTPPTKTKGVKFPDLAAKKGTKPAIGDNRRRLLDLLEKSPAANL
jgi:hypothetical protein